MLRRRYVAVFLIAEPARPDGRLLSAGPFFTKGNQIVDALATRSVSRAWGGMEGTASG